MAGAWQRVKDISGSGGWPGISFVTSIFNRNSYKDLDNENNDSVLETPEPLDKCDDVSPDSGPLTADVEKTDAGRQSENVADCCDAGVGQRRRCMLLFEEPTISTNGNTKDSHDVSNLTEDVTCENSHNELIETNNKLPPAPVEEISSPEGRSLDSRDLSSSSEQSHGCDTDESHGGRMRRRRDSYDRALSEMRDSYDRVFTEILDHSQDSAAVLPVDESERHTETVVRYPGDDKDTSTAGFDLPEDAVVVNNNYRGASPKLPLRRQISDVIQKDLPSAIHVIRNRNYSKLGEDPEEIQDITHCSDAKPESWRESALPQKKKSANRKRTKKVHKGSIFHSLTCLSKSGYARK